MKIKDLKKLTEKPEKFTEEEWDEVDVMIPVSGEFDGFWRSPCLEDSGEAEFGLDEDGLNTETMFVIVPCGFFEEHKGVPCELN